MNHSQSLSSYVPVSELLDGKQQSPLRACREDCAVIECGNTLRILASRGRNLTVGEDLEKLLCINASSRARIDQALKDRRRLCVTANDRPLLFFTDWYATTGLCLVILPHAPADAIQTILPAFERQAFTVLEEAEHKRASVRERREASELLTELFSYTDRIFAPREMQINSKFMLATLALFAGCRPIIAPYPTMQQPPSLAPRTVAFLFCTLLYLRTREGEISKEATEAAYRITLLPSGDQLVRHSSASVPSPLFASSPCFLPLDIADADGQTVLTLRDPDLQATLRSVPFKTASEWLLCIDRIPLPVKNS